VPVSERRMDAHMSDCAATCRRVLADETSAERSSIDEHTARVRRSVARNYSEARKTEHARAVACVHSQGSSCSRIRRYSTATAIANGSTAERTPETG
jgi:hypothetical protein